jgi:hypothetical protein
MVRDSFRTSHLLVGSFTLGGITASNCRAWPAAQWKPGEAQAPFVTLDHQARRSSRWPEHTPAAALLVVCGTSSMCSRCWRIGLHH